MQSTFLSAPQIHFLIIAQSMYSPLNTEATQHYKKFMRAVKPHYSSLSTRTDKTKYTAGLAEDFFRLENTRCLQYKDKVLTEIDNPDDLRPRLAQAFREKWSTKPFKWFNGNNSNVASYFSIFQLVVVSDEDSASSQDNISVESDSETNQNDFVDDLEPLPLSGLCATLEEMEELRNFVLDAFLP